MTLNDKKEKLQTRFEEVKNKYIIEITKYPFTEKFYYYVKSKNIDNALKKVLVEFRLASCVRVLTDLNIKITKTSMYKKEDIVLIDRKGNS
jgi:hypothetical protein